MGGKIAVLVLTLLSVKGGLFDEEEGCVVMIEELLPETQLM